MSPTGAHIYVIPTGEWFGPDGVLIGKGYSGALAGGGQNNPAMIAVKDVGPIPPGDYTIGPAHTHPVLGPLTMNLDPDAANEMFDRDAFRCHGRAASAPLDSSKGCVVMDHVTRGWIAISTCRRLRVLIAAPALT